MHDSIISFTVDLKEAAEVQSLSPNIDSFDGDTSSRGKCCIEKPQLLKWYEFIALISTTTKKGSFSFNIRW